MLAVKIFLMLRSNRPRWAVSVAFISDKKIVNKFARIG